MAATTEWDLELLLADGTTWAPFTLAGSFAEDGTPMPKTVTEALAASDADLPTNDQLIPVIAEDFSGGIGISHNVSPGVYTRTPPFACPAGFSTDFTVPLTNNSTSDIRAIEIFGPDVWFLQAGDGVANTARVMRSVGGTGVLDDADASTLHLGAGRYLHDLCVSHDGAGAPALFASSSNASDFAGADGALHRWNGATWSSTTPGGAKPAGFDANGRGKMKRVYWTTTDTNGTSSGWRLVALSSRRMVSYTRPDSDPLNGNNWIEAVPMGTVSNDGILSLAAARRHFWGAAPDGLFDLDELGHSPNLLGSGADVGLPYTGMASQYLNQFVYMSYGSGISRIYVGADGALQEYVGQCGPGWNTRSEHRWTGPSTAMTTDQGYLVSGHYNPVVGISGIFWGIDRTTLGGVAGVDIKTPNPLVWYGPEVVGAVDNIVRAMKVVSTGGGLRLWVSSSRGVIGDAAVTPRLSWISLPVSGAPIQDLLSSSVHRFNTGSSSGRWQANCYIEGLPITLDDTVSLKHLHLGSVASRGPLTSNGVTKLIYRTRADPAPGVNSYTTATDVTVSPNTDVAPVTVVSGHRLQWMVDFVSGLGASTPAVISVLDAVRITLWKTVPTLIYRDLVLEYGDGVVSRSGSSHTGETYTPRQIRDWLTDLARAGRTTMRDAQDNRWTIKVMQVLDTKTPGQGIWGATMQSRVRVAVIAGPL